MFTGIIREIGTLAEKKCKKDGGLILRIHRVKIKPSVGDSISVNGACLTVTREDLKKKAYGFEVEIVEETLKSTNLGNLDIGAAVNLEPSLRIGDKLDGHLVNGHVDAVARVISNGKYLEVELPRKLKRFIAKKGSVAVNGVSLTVAKVGKTLTAALIPFTKKHTNLGNLAPGDFVNIEVDLIARYILGNF